MQDLYFELRVEHDADCFLKNVVAELMSHKSLYDLIDSELLVSRVRAELAIQDLVVPVVRALEHLVDLHACLARLEALLDDV